VNRRRPTNLLTRAAVAASLLGAAGVLAQLAPKAQSGGQVNPQVNSALYGGGVSASVRYAGVGSTSVAMGSEVRYASWTSGALPSDISMGRASLGPLHPAGPMAYVPPPKPSYMPSPSTSVPQAVGKGAFDTGSIRYSGSRASSTATYMAPQSVGGAVSRAAPVGGQVNAGPINAGPISGAVRYGR
jgi:hypothetical protein